MKDTKIKLLLVIIAIFISILLGIFLPVIVNIISGGTEKVTISEQILFALVLSIFFMFLEFLYSYNESLQLKKEDHKFWEIKNRGDQDLYNMRASYHVVVQDSKTENDIFVLHFEKEFKKLKKKISEVADKKELFVSADYFLNADNVLKVFPSFEESTWRYVWKIENIDIPLFKEHSWRQFFEKTAKMVQQKKMKEIRAIIVISKPEFIKSERIKKLLDFFKTNEKINCRLIAIEDFESVCKLNSVEISLSDFGLYGNQLLFTEKYQGGEVSGFFSKDASQIHDYSKLFECFWEAKTITDDNPSEESTTIDVDTLIRFDLNYKNEKN